MQFLLIVFWPIVFLEEKKMSLLTERKDFLCSILLDISNSICMLNSIIIVVIVVRRLKRALLSQCQIEVVDAAGWRQQVDEMLAQRCIRKEREKMSSFSVNICQIEPAYSSTT